MEEFQNAIKSQTEKSQDLCDMTPLEYIKFCSNISGFAGEFPWESYEDSPFALIEKLRLEIAGKQ